MPMTVFERDELGAATFLANNWLLTGCTPFGEQLRITVGTVRFFLFQCELLTSQSRLAIGAQEALFMIGGVFVGDAIRSDDLCAKKEVWVNNIRMINSWQKVFTCGS